MPTALQDRRAFDHMEFNIQGLMTITIFVFVTAFALAALICHHAGTRRRGWVVIACWLIVPPLAVTCILLGSWFAMEFFGRGHCGHEDYFCADWPRLAIAQSASALVTVIGLVAITLRWWRSRGSKRLQS